MATVNARAFKVTENSREFLQHFIVEQIPEDTKYILASSEGYLFFNEEPGPLSADGRFRFPRMAILTYFDIQYESE